MLESGRVRLRPILMTSFATIMGALPIALGSRCRLHQPPAAGLCVVGGVFFSTMLTLFLVPVVWVIFEGLRHRAVQPNPEAVPAAVEAH